MIANCNSYWEWRLYQFQLIVSHNKDYGVWLSFEGKQTNLFLESESISLLCLEIFKGYLQQNNDENNPVYPIPMIRANYPFF